MNLKQARRKLGHYSIAEAAAECGVPRYILDYAIKHGAIEPPTFKPPTWRRCVYTLDEVKKLKRLFSDDSK